MKLKSYAKLNLYLEVFRPALARKGGVRKRKDNYHNILTLFERISLHDKILLSPRPDNKITIRCNRRDVPQDSRNLAFRAAVLLREKAGVKKGVDIKIIKNIPVAAGLGGGSSNAAAALLGLNQLWRLNYSKKELIRLAKRLGADVPFFLYGVSFAFGKERGDKIEVLCGIKKKFWHILVVPRLLVSTPQVYKAFDRKRKFVKGYHLIGLTKAPNNAKILPLALRKGNVPGIGPFLFNRLEETTFALYPQIKNIKSKLSHLGVKAILMSGSGPAMFGIVSSRKEGESLCRRLRKRSTWEIFTARTI